VDNLESIAASLKETDFLKQLLATLVERGLGTLPARETALTFIDLLFKHHPEWKTSPPGDYELARILKTSPKRIRSIRDDLSYRDDKKSEDWCKKSLAEILRSAERVKEGDYIVFQVDDGLLRDYAQKLVRKNEGIFEAGFVSSTIKISGKSFIGLALLLLDDDAREKVLASIPEDKKNEVKESSKTNNPLRVFVESFVKGAGAQAGKKAVDLGFTLMTGGLSDVSSAIEVIKGFFSK